MKFSAFFLSRLLKNVVMLAEVPLTTPCPATYGRAALSETDTCSQRIPQIQQIVALHINTDLVQHKNSKGAWDIHQR